MGFHFRKRSPSVGPHKLPQLGCCVKYRQDRGREIRSECSFIIAHLALPPVLAVAPACTAWPHARSISRCLCIWILVVGSPSWETAPHWALGSHRRPLQHSIGPREMSGKAQWRSPQGKGGIIAIDTIYIYFFSNPDVRRDLNPYQDPNQLQVRHPFPVL